MTDTKDTKDTKDSAASFGVNEVVLTLLCAFTGFLDFSKRELLYVLAVTALASSIPDLFSFYTIARKDKKMSMKDSFISTLPVMGSEIVTTIILGIPLFMFNRRKARVFFTLLTGFSMIALNQSLVLKSDVSETIETTFFAMLAVGLAYVIARMLKKIKV
jgi:Ca2+/Na+ antiporter